MREILFRAKSVNDLKWVEGFYVREDGHFIKELPSAVTTPIHLVYPDTVEQFTGFTDKNDKRIFEGDIVKNEYEDGKYQKFKIFYNVKTLQWEVMNKYGMRGILRNVIGNMEVIGNIHDNQELLENP